MSFELVFEGYRMVFASCEGFDGLFFVQTCCFFASAGGRDFVGREVGMGNQRCGVGDRPLAWHLRFRRNAV